MGRSVGFLPHELRYQEDDQWQQWDPSAEAWERNDETETFEGFDAEYCEMGSLYCDLAGFIVY